LFDEINSLALTLFVSSALIESWSTYRVPPSVRHRHPTKPILAMLRKPSRSATDLENGLGFVKSSVVKKLSQSGAFVEPLPILFPSKSIVERPHLFSVQHKQRLSPHSANMNTSGEVSCYISSLFSPFARLPISIILRRSHRPLRSHFRSVAV